MENKEEYKTNKRYFLLRFINSSFFKRYWSVIVFVLFLLLLILIAKFFGFGDRFTMAPPEPLEWKEIGSYLPLFAVFSAIGALVVYLFNKRSK